MVGIIQLCCTSLPVFTNFTYTLSLTQWETSPPQLRRYKAWSTYVPGLNVWKLRYSVYRNLKRLQSKILQFHYSCHWWVVLWNFVFGLLSTVFQNTQCLHLLPWRWGPDSSKMLLPIYQTTQHKIPEDCNLNVHHCENVKSCQWFRIPNSSVALWVGYCNIKHLHFRDHLYNLRNRRKLQCPIS